MNPDDKDAAIKLINAAYSALDTLNNITLPHHRDKLHRIALAEEKAHRKSHEGSRWGITPIMAARMFSVRAIVRALEKPEAVTIADVLTHKESVVYAAAIAATYPRECAEALAPFDRAAILALDYVQLIKTE